MTTITLKKHMNLYRDLVDTGEPVSINRVGRLMLKNSIQSKIACKFVITTSSMQPESDQLQRKFKVDAPDKTWASDATFIPTRQGWFYLAVVI